MTQKITILSGGLDSTATLAVMLGKLEGAEPLAIAFDYGQTHLVELEAARAVAVEMKVPLKLVDVRGLLAGGSLLGEGDIPDGHYADETMKSTVVHARNMLFASIAVSLAGEGGEVWLGVHGGDHHIYPDCRPTFWEPYREAVLAAYGVRVQTPFLFGDKSDAVAAGVALGAPLHLTWSCYKGGSVQCGTCGTCIERREAFKVAGVPDRTEYLP